MTTNAFGRLRLITFDVANTLLKFRTSPAKQYGEIGALFGVVCDKDKLAKNFIANWHMMNAKYPNFGRNSYMDWQQWWRQVIGGTFADSGTQIADDKLVNLSNHLIELYKTSLCWQHCNGSIDLLNYLRLHQQRSATKNHPNSVDSPTVLAVIANFDPRLDMLLSNLKIKHYFNYTINSYDSNAEKPNREIFELAMRMSNLKDLQPEQCLHIGDGPTTDYLAAKNVGWNAALIAQESNVNQLVEEYGTQIEEHFIFPSLFDFQKKFSNNLIKWL